MTKIWFKVEYNKAPSTTASVSPDALDGAAVTASTEGVLCLPDCYSEAGKPVPLIFSAHGSGSTVNEAEDKTGGIAYVRECIARGYAAFDINGTRPDGKSCGCPAYVDAAWRAYNYVIENYNLDPRLFLAGASMGGLSAMNFLNSYPSAVRAVGLFYPRLNLLGEEVDGTVYRGNWDREKNGEYVNRVPFADSYGFQSAEAFEVEKTVGFNPYRNHAVTVNGERYIFVPCPLKIWHGTEDVTVHYPLSVEYVRAVRRAGCRAELRTLERTGHRHSEVMRTELCMWFDRFR